MPNTHIRIAIIGGGLAGVSLAIALAKIPHLEIEVYESAPTFSERGAGIGLATNAQRALEDILGSLQAAKDVLDKAGAVTLSPTRFMLVSETV
jgi:salicylate hydroxylase